ncbi:hypothetical protein F5Y17DRAFT_425677 [Xylariaceae sp. FL0594]|nr:hypothetical protein F5Y17DRAFT_425677 [Xylariaceae sp. FL0594]
MHGRDSFGRNVNEGATLLLGRFPGAGYAVLLYFVLLLLLYSSTKVGNKCCFHQLLNLTSISFVPIPVIIIVANFSEVMRQKS